MSTLIIGARENLGTYLSMPFSGALPLWLVSEARQAKDTGLRRGKDEPLADN